MIQKSVYVRYSKTLSSLDSEDNKIKKVTPDTISIRIIALSKLLFKSMKHINCEEVLIHEENDIICI